MMTRNIMIAVVASAILLTFSFYLVNKQNEIYIHEIPEEDSEEKIRLGGIPWDFINCGTEFDPLVITSVVFSGQPERGAPPNDAVISGSVMQHEVYQSVNVQVKLNNVQVFNSNLPCTGTYDAGDMFIFNYAFQVPGIAPGGPYSVYFRFMNKQGGATSCTQVNMDL